MKIKRYIEFLKESDEDEFDMEGDNSNVDTEDPIEEEEEKDYVSNDSPESYITSKLTNIKSKIDNMFSDGNTSDKEMTVNSDDIDKKIKSDDIDGVSFKDLGMNIESSEIGKSTKTHKNLTVKFSDNEFYYSLLFKIDLKQVTGKKREDDEEMTTDMIKKCFVKFKKYSIDDNYSLLGEISKMVKISDIDEDFIVGLKIELDDEIGGNEDNFSIEYED